MHYVVAYQEEYELVFILLISKVIHMYITPRHCFFCLIHNFQRDSTIVMYLFIQELAQKQPEGDKILRSTVDLGEKLYPSTSLEGREIIRQELRNLREQWEQYTDGVGDWQRHLHSALEQWNGYTASYDDLVTWVKDTEYKLTCDIDLKNSLVEKKAMLHGYKVGLLLDFA